MQHSTARDLFDYNAETGELIHKHGPRKGQVVGCLNYAGYRITLVAKKNFRVPRLIWLWVTGELPAHTIDHIDRNRDNNRWSNLRDVPKEQQTLNKGTPTNNKSGFRGVSLRPSGRYEASYQYRGKRTYFGMYDTAIEASKAYEQGKRLMATES